MLTFSVVVMFFHVYPTFYFTPLPCIWAPVHAILSFAQRWRDPRRRLRVLISFLPPDAIPFSGQTLIQSTFKRVATGGIHKNKRKK